MDKMLKKMDQVKEKFQFNQKEEIIEYICRNFYLTNSEIREIFQKIEEMSILEDKNIYKILTEFEIDKNENLKKNGEKFLEYVRELRHPIIYAAKKKADTICSKIKGKNIKISYPENFEGSGIKIEININGRKEVERILEKLIRDREAIEELVDIVKNGG